MLKMSEYGKYLNPDRSIRVEKGVKGERKNRSVTTNPSSVTEGHRFTLEFPSLGADDVIVPGSVKLCGKVGLESKTDENIRVVDNYGRNRFVSMAVRVEGEEIMNLQNSNVLLSWLDLWLSDGEKMRLVEQGVISSVGMTENCLKLRCGSKDGDSGKKEDKVLADVFGDRFCTPLDFELLKTAAPFYQHGLKGRLQFDFVVNSVKNVVISTDKEANLVDSNLSLDFETVRDAGLAVDMKKKMVNYDPVFDRITLVRHETVRDADTLWNFEVNVTCKSLKGILFLFKNDADFDKKTDEFVFPNIDEVKLQVKGISNVFYDQGMKRKDFYEEAYRHFVGRNKEVSDNVYKEAGVTGMNIQNYYSKAFGLWIDFRTVHDNSIHGSGTRLAKVGDLVNLEVRKKAGTLGNLNCYIYAFMDGIMHFRDGKFVSVEY